MLRMRQTNAVYELGFADFDSTHYHHMFCIIEYCVYWLEHVAFPNLLTGSFLWAHVFVLLFSLLNIILQDCILTLHKL